MFNSRNSINFFLRYFLECLIFKKSIKTFSKGVFRDKRSKFFSYIHLVSNKKDAMLWVDFYKKEQSEGRHHCYADGKELRSCDDGEPLGTVGKPILNQLLSKKKPT